MLPTTLFAALALVPALVHGAIFTRDSKVKQIDAKAFKKVMQEERASMVAFVAPWCGHCQRLAPEYSKAAAGLDPLVPLYAVDCDAAPNKQLCAEQGVQGFPTVKFFRRGAKLPALDYQGERTSKAVFNYVARNVPSVGKLHKSADDVAAWAEKHASKPRALLLHKDKKVPLLWQVLSNQHRALEFGALPDTRGAAAAGMGFADGDADKVASKVLVYAKDGAQPVLYEGPLKYDALNKFFKSVLDGSAKLTPKDARPAADEL